MNTIIAGFFTAFFIVLLTTPSLIKVAKLKHLVDEPSEDRKVHKTSIPTIGGIILFAAILFSYALFFPTNDVVYNDNVYSLEGAMNEFKYLTACLIILFFVGVKDDIIGTAPTKKLMGHITVALILVVMGGLRIKSMYGIFGIEEIPEWASIFISIFTYIVVINAFNLIDGVDGLAAGIGLICSCFFGIWFWHAGSTPLSLLSFVLAGSLLGFLFFNFSPARVFMGDSGSLIIGLTLAFLAVKLLEFDVSRLPKNYIKISKPVFVVAVLIYPLLDTLRVFMIRTAKGRSPFSADRSHIHHRLMALGLNHRKTASCIYAFNIVIISIVMFTSRFLPSISLTILIVSTVTISSIPFIFFKPSEAE